MILVRIRSLLLWLVGILILLTPIPIGLNAPWGWGLVFAGVLLTTTVVLILDLIIPFRHRLIPILFSKHARIFSISGLLFLLWTTALYFYDLSASKELLRLPSQSLIYVIFAWAYAAALIVGLKFGLSGKSLRKLAVILFLCCIGYSIINIAQRFGWFPLTFMGLETTRDRPGGLYPNANRYAVLLTLGWTCGVALITAILLNPFSKRRKPKRVARKRRILMVLLLTGIAVITLGLGLSLSRMTLGVLAAGVLLVAFTAALKTVRWLNDQKLIGRSRRFKFLSSSSSNKWLKFGAPIFIGLLAVMILLTVGGQKFGERVKQGYPDFHFRVEGMTLSAELVPNKPVIGYGAGSFDFHFRAIQPMHISGRWDRVHNDWIQTCVELGIPALVLLILMTLFWWKLWYQRLKFNARCGPFLFTHIMALAIFVPLLCSLASYPLRQPSNGLIFFLLLGALTSYLTRIPDEKEKSKEESIQEVLTPHEPVPAVNPAKSGLTFSRVLALLVSLPLLVAFLLTAFQSGKTGWATANSPWLGTIYPPSPKPELAEGYRKALAIAPENYELKKEYFNCLWWHFEKTNPEKLPQEKKVYENVLKELLVMNPLDHELYYRHGFYLWSHNKLNEASEQFEIASRLRPGNVVLRKHAGSFILQNIVPTLKIDSKERNTQIEKAFQHFRAIMNEGPELTRKQFHITALKECENAHLEVQETINLWNEDSDDHRFSRARFWLGRRAINLVQKELDAISDSKKNQTEYLIYQGAIDFSSHNFERAIESWKVVFERNKYKLAPHFKPLLSNEIKIMPIKGTAKLYDTSGLDIIWHPHLAYQLALRLFYANDFSRCNQLLIDLVDRHPNPWYLRLWALLATKYRDYETAITRHEKAFAQSDKSEQWKKIHKQFVENCRRQIDVEKINKQRR